MGRLQQKAADAHHILTLSGAALPPAAHFPARYNVTIEAIIF
jgi:hypothetical protein